MKVINLFRIYSNRVVSRNGKTIKVATDLAFTTPQEASKYCRELNKRSISPDLIRYTYEHESINVCKKAEELTCDPVEDLKHLGRR